MTQCAVVVFSGGQDSTTCLIQALEQYHQVHCLTFDYGQRHRAEIEAACRLVKQFGVKYHQILDVNLLSQLSASSLTRSDISVPTDIRQDVPNTFVPGRNILFLTFAAIYAYQVNAGTIITGVCETDFSGYPDCRNEFIKSLNQTVTLGLGRNINIMTPLMWLTKAETWALADYYHHLDTIRHQTLTCYNGIMGDGCGTCPACQLRMRGLTQYIENPSFVMQQLKNKTGLA